MPIYEYQCAACGHQLEILQKISEDPVKMCPKCNKESLQKLISAAGFQLKGTGWYATDFRNKGKSEAKDKAAPNDNKGSDDKSATTTGEKN